MLQGVPFRQTFILIGHIWDVNGDPVLELYFFSIPLYYWQQGAPFRPALIFTGHVFTLKETKVIFRSGGKAIVISEIEKTGLELNERQRKALQYVLEKGFITNRAYQELNDVGKKTAYLELSGLLEKGLLSSTGKGRSVRYVTRF
jgi:hypothetical protein